MDEHNCAFHSNEWFLQFKRGRDKIIAIKNSEHNERDTFGI